VRSKVVLVAVLLLAAFGRAWAGPPFLTDDPEPVPYRHWEFYLFGTMDDGPGAAVYQGPAVEVNYGAVPGLQLHLVVPMAWSVPAQGPSATGLGDAEVGLKFRFLSETRDRPEMGIFPMAEVPTGSAAKGLGNGQVWYKLPLWIQKSWGPWTTYGGGGYVINRAPAQRSYPFAGWLLQRDLSEKWTLGGELFGQGAQSVGGSGFTLANLGGAYNFTRGFSLLFSLGRTIRGERHTVAYLALYWTWGPH
jgi:hypothetical protein